MTADQKKAFFVRMARAKKVAKANRGKPASAGTQSHAKKRKPARKPNAAARPSHAKNRRNPAGTEACEAMYEQFHGAPPNRILEYEGELEYRAELAELGALKELRFRLEGETKAVPLTDFGPCQVTCTPDGNNIYFLGGKQDVDLSQLQIESDKDYVELGPCTYIMYHTRKGFHQFAPIDYFHHFGEENGITPVLTYDSQNKALFLIGGDYHCKPEGIRN